MTTADSAFKKTEILLMALLGLVAMALVTVAVIPHLRTKAKALFFGSDRQVLAKVTGHLAPQGPQVTVLKIKSQSVLSLEVFTQDTDGNLILMTKIPLFEVRDGHFFLKGNATNLALTDMNNDGNFEIIAPTYNEQMVPRLNIFKYNPSTQSFDRAIAPAEFEP